MKQQSKDNHEGNKVELKWSGICIAAWFLVVGIILFSTPIYIGVGGWIEMLINGVGWIAIVISFGGTLIEFTNIFKNDGFSYLGVSLIFFIPAILIHFLQNGALYNNSIIIILKIIVIFLLIIGSGIAIYGVSFFLEEVNDDSIEEKAMLVNKTRNKKSYIEFISSIVIAILALLTAIIQFISKV